MLSRSLRIFLSLRRRRQTTMLAANQCVGGHAAIEKNRPPGSAFLVAHGDGRDLAQCCAGRRRDHRLDESSYEVPPRKSEPENPCSKKPTMAAPMSAFVNSPRQEKGSSIVRSVRGAACHLAGLALEIPCHEDSRMPRGPPGNRLAPYSLEMSLLHLKKRTGAHAFPYPPAVGVWMMTASPASIDVSSQPCSFSMWPSLRRTAFSPTWPASPPARPKGRTRR
jgi:hypothetical protein